MKSNILSEQRRPQNNSNAPSLPIFQMEFSSPFLIICTSTHNDPKREDEVNQTELILNLVSDTLPSVRSEVTIAIKGKHRALETPTFSAPKMGQKSSQNHQPFQCPECNSIIHSSSYAHALTLIQRQIG